MDYQLIQELHEIKDGRYIKWLKEKWRGGFVLKVEIEEDGARILVKSGKYIMTCMYDECIIYQKLSLDEQLINRIESLL